MIQNYISLSLNGYYKASEIENSQTWKDMHTVTLDEDDIVKIMDSRKTNYSINRFFKKL